MLKIIECCKAFQLADITAVKKRKNTFKLRRGLRLLWSEVKGSSVGFSISDQLKRVS